MSFIMTLPYIYIIYIDHIHPPMMSSCPAPSFSESMLKLEVLGNMGDDCPILIQTKDTKL